ncbi:MAG: acetate--CoA ligase family protein, partial [Dethiobacteria bacterium]
ILPSFGAVGNPVDLTSQLFFDTELFQQSLRLVMQDPDVDIGGFFYNLEMPDPDADKKIIDVYNDIKKPLVIFTWPTGQDYAMEAKQKIIQAGIPVIEHIPSGLWAIKALADWVGKSAEIRVYPSYQPGVEQEKALQVIRKHTAPNKKMLTENVSKQILQAYKIPVTREIAVQTADEAVRAAENIGYPLVMKILSPHIPHKSDAGGVVLNIDDAAGIRKAYEQIMANAIQYKADAHIEGALVQEMLESGLEVIVGVKKDPLFGPAIVLGLGGIFVEVLEDASTRIAPLREEDAREMIDELKGRTLFDGIRGQRPRDKGALVSVLLQVSRLAVELEDVIEEMDINPLVVYEEGKGVIAADALIVNAG